MWCPAAITPVCRSGKGRRTLGCYLRRESSDEQSETPAVATVDRRREGSLRNLQHYLQSNVHLLHEDIG